MEKADTQFNNPVFKEYLEEEAYFNSDEENAGLLSDT